MEELALMMGYGVGKLLATYFGRPLGAPLKAKVV